MTFANLIFRRAKSRDIVPDVGAIQVDIGEWDPLFDLEHHHVPDTWQGAPSTHVRADVPPPFPIEEAEEVPRKSAGIVLDVYYPHTRPGVGPDDLEPMIPEGELGF